jgi:hydrogenase maturation protease
VIAPRVLVIGYGNTLRGDDGAGPAVAERLRGRRGVEARAVHQLTPELAPALAEADAAVFVDARVARGDAGVEVTPLAPGGDGPPLGHGSDPRALLALTHALHGRVPRAWWVTLPAESFELGETLSAVTREAVTRAVDVIRALAVEARRA